MHSGIESGVIAGESLARHREADAVQTERLSGEFTASEAVFDVRAARMVSRR
jgi:hypothetical protein